MAYYLRLCFKNSDVNTLLLSRIIIIEVLILTSFKSPNLKTHLIFINITLIVKLKLLRHDNISLLSHVRKYYNQIYLYKLITQINVTDYLSNPKFRDNRRIHFRTRPSKVKNPVKWNFLQNQRNSHTFNPFLLNKEELP